MVSDQGQVKILDFGLATLTQADPVSDVTRIPFVPAPVGLTVSPDERGVLITRPVLGGSDLLVVEGFR